jgi:hypothetical protein
MSETLHSSRSGYYQWLRSDQTVRAREELAVRNQIEEVHKQSRGTYGSPRVTVALRAHGTSVGHISHGLGTVIVTDPQGQLHLPAPCNRR